jgi:hypothetical protein
MIGYPLSVSPDQGLSLAVDPIRDQILALIDCRFWERSMFTDFGVPDLTFDNLDPGTIATYLAQLKIAIDYWVATDCTVALESTSTDLEAGVIGFSISVPESPGPFLFSYAL